MPKLILALDGALLGEFPLDKKTVTIGRRPANDIHIDNLAVSGEHARVVTVGAESLIEDLDSTNGTLLNGAPIRKQSLQHGDAIVIGKYQLTFLREGSDGSAPPADFENTILMSPGLQEEPAAEPIGQEAASAQLPPACVQILNGPATGKELPLTKTLTTLGKAGVQVAVITRRPLGYYITHVEGAQTPQVNGAAIGVQATKLEDHDVIELAGVKMEFYLAES